MSNARNSRGYTLAELMVVVTIVGILVLIAVASFSVAISRASAASCAATRNAMNRSVEVFFAETGHYPAGMDDLQGHVSNWESATSCPSGTQLLYVVSTHEIVCPVHGP